MDDDLKNIKNLIIDIVKLNEKKYKLKHNNKYICKNYDTYKIEYYETCTRLVDTRKLFVKKCNEYINYPKKRKFIFFDRTNKIQFKEESFIGLTLKIPYIDKKEYFCLINLFKTMVDYIEPFGYIESSYHHESTWIFK